MSVEYDRMLAEYCKTWARCPCHYWGGTAIPWDFGQLSRAASRPCHCYVLSTAPHRQDACATIEAFMRYTPLAILVALLVSFTAPPTPAADTSALINEALDKLVSLQLDGVLPQVMAK